MRPDIRNLCLASFIFLACSLCGCGGPANTASANATPEPIVSPSFPPPPPVDARPKVVAFGDSFTSGLGIDDWRENYPSLLQTDLDRAGFNLQVIDRGRAGDTSTQGLARLDEALGVGEIHIFILALGGNDVFKKVPIDETRASLAKIAKAVSDKGAKVLLCGYRPVDADAAKPMDAMYSDLAVEHHLVLLPSLLEGVQQVPKLLLPDGVHPNEDGAKVVEQNVWRAIQPLLRDEPKVKR